MKTQLDVYCGTSHWAVLSRLGAASVYSVGFGEGFSRQRGRGHVREG